MIAAQPTPSTDMYIEIKGRKFKVETKKQLAVAKQALREARVFSARIWENEIGFAHPWQGDRFVFADDA